MDNVKKRIEISIIFLGIGLFIYFVYNIKFIAKSNVLFEISRNYIPDICWTISFFFISINFTKNITKRYILYNSLYILVIALLFELFQCYKVIPGTFDIIDIIIYILSIYLSCIIELFIGRKENEKI